MLQSVIYKYNYHPYKNSGLKSNINKILKLRSKNQIGKPGINGLFIATLLFTVPLLSFFCTRFLLLHTYIPANLLTYQKCCHIKLNFLSSALILYLIRYKFNEIPGVLQFDL